MTNQKDQSDSFVPIIMGITVGGLLGGITAALLRNPERRKGVLTWLMTADERTLRLRSYLSRSLAAYRRGLEAEIRTSAEETLREAKNTSYAA